MADADEDAFLPASSSSASGPSSRTHPQLDNDPTEEAQDFRFLAALSRNTSDDTSSDFSIPRRGEKEFEPLPLISQNAALDASRAAMYVALSAPRVHSGKSHVVGLFIESAEGEDVRKMEGRCVRIDNFRGTLVRTIGKADSGGRTWLWPEEALFLLERGSLDVRWPLEEQEDCSETEAAIIEGVAEDADGYTEETDGKEAIIEPEGIPMSLQGAYASFLGNSGLTLERYLVFSGLRRLGYIVTRAPTWSDEEVGLNGHARHPEGTQDPASTALTAPDQISSTSGPVSLITRWFQSLFAPRRGVACPSLGPLVAPGLYRNYNDIFRALTLIPYCEPASSNSRPQVSKPQPRPPFRIAFHVYKPNTKYRKSSPPDPDFRIVVLDARSTTVPTAEQIGTLLDSLPDDELPKDKRLEQRIKHGKRHVILAVVDSGVVSYLRLSESGFGSIKLFEGKTARGGKRGGYRGRGRGRGKGR